VVFEEGRLIKKIATLVIREGLRKTRKTEAQGQLELLAKFRGGWGKSANKKTRGGGEARREQSWLTILYCPEAKKEEKIYEQGKHVVDF